MIGGFLVELIDEVMNELENNVIIIISSQPQVPVYLGTYSVLGVFVARLSACVYNMLYWLYTRLYKWPVQRTVPLSVALAGLALHSWV